MHMIVMNVMNVQNVLQCSIKATRAFIPVFILVTF
jgi:hypothetical protein